MVVEQQLLTATALVAAAAAAAVWYGDVAVVNDAAAAVASRDRFGQCCSSCLLRNWNGRAGGIHLDHCPALRRRWGVINRVFHFD